MTGLGKTLGRPRTACDPCARLGSKCLRLQGDMPDCAPCKNLGKICTWHQVEEMMDKRKVWEAGKALASYGSSTMSQPDNSDKGTVSGAVSFAGRGSTVVPSLPITACGTDSLQPSKMSASIFSSGYIWNRVLLPEESGVSPRKLVYRTL